MSVSAICDEYCSFYPVTSFHGQIIPSQIVPPYPAPGHSFKGSPVDEACVYCQVILFLLLPFPTAFPWWYLNKASKLQTSLRNNEFCTCTDCFLIFSIIITSTDNFCTLQCSKKTRQAKTWVSFLSTVQLMICWEPYALCSVDYWSSLLKNLMYISRHRCIRNSCD